MERIPKGIVVTTSEYTKDWLRDCLLSIGNKYPILIVSNGNFMPFSPINAPIVLNDWNGFELGGVLRGKEYFDHFVHLMDTCVIKDQALFDELFDYPGHVFLTEGGYHYMGKFESDDLPEIPKVTTKADAITYELTWLNGKPRAYFKPDLPVHTNVFEEKHGSRRMRLENDYIIKWKGTWSL